MPDNRIKNEKQYRALRKKGYSKEKSARIANTEDAGIKGCHATKYEERSKQELYEEAQKIGIKGRSKMSKKELIYALRHN